MEKFLLWSVTQIIAPITTLNYIPHAQHCVSACDGDGEDEDIKVMKSNKQEAAWKGPAVELTQTLWLASKTPIWQFSVGMMGTVGYEAEGTIRKMN